MSAAQAVQAAIESFCDELGDRAHEHVEGILTGDKDELGKSVIRQDPEQFVCQYLVWPICRAMEYEHITERSLMDTMEPLNSLSRVRNVSNGEVKRVNNYKRAIRDFGTT